MNNIFYILILSLFLLVFSSCSKEEENKGPNGNNPPPAEKEYFYVKVKEKITTHYNSTPGLPSSTTEYQYFYDESGREIEHKRFNNGDWHGWHRNYIHDEKGRVIYYEDWHVAENRVDWIVEIEYDEYGNQLSNLSTHATNGKSREQVQQFDASNRVIFQGVFDNDTLVNKHEDFTHNSMGKPLSYNRYYVKYYPDNFIYSTTENTYRDDTLIVKSVVTEKDSTPDILEHFWEYDSLGRLVDYKFMPNSWLVEHRSNYEYDENNNLTHYEFLRGSDVHKQVWLEYQAFEKLDQS